VCLSKTRGTRRSSDSGLRCNFKAVKDTVQLTSRSRHIFQKLLILLGHSATQDILLLLTRDLPSILVVLFFTYMGARIAQSL
jgi:hypothetical protein